MFTNSIFSKFDNTIIFIRNITNAYYIITKKGYLNKYFCEFQSKKLYIVKCLYKYEKNKVSL